MHFSFDSQEAFDADAEWKKSQNRVMTSRIGLRWDCLANNEGKNSLLYTLAGIILKNIQQTEMPRDCHNQIGLGSPDEVMR